MLRKYLFVQQTATPIKVPYSEWISCWRNAAAVNTLAPGRLTQVGELIRPAAHFEHLS